MFNILFLLLIVLSSTSLYSMEVHDKPEQHTPPEHQSHHRKELMNNESPKIPKFPVNRFLKIAKERDYPNTPTPRPEPKDLRQDFSN